MREKTLHKLNNLMKEKDKFLLTILDLRKEVDKSFNQVNELCASKNELRQDIHHIQDRFDEYLKTYFQQKYKASIDFSILKTNYCKTLQDNVKLSKNTIKHMEETTSKYHQANEATAFATNSL